MAARMRFIDIGANLTDPVFRGLYRGKQAHPDDFQKVLKRAHDYGVEKIFVTGGSLVDSRRAAELARQHESLYCTVGCHPTRCQDFERHPRGADDYLESLLSLSRENTGKVVAIGECGLDYDRLHFCPKEVQIKYFEREFSLVESTQLPMFLHCRNAHGDFTDIIRRNWGKMKGGVVHSFTGSIEEAKALTDVGLYIGINGCSLKTEENLATAVSIPADRLMIETDAPWCEIKPSHASSKHTTTRFECKKKERWDPECLVKSRNEPAAIVQVMEVLASVRGEDLASLAGQVFDNTRRLFSV